MKQNKLFLGLATLFAAAFTFAACSSDDAETQNAQQERTIRLTSSLEKGGTRATSDPQGSTLSTSSSLGVFAINNSTALTNGDNEKYSVDGSGNLTPTTETNKMTWPASGTVSFYAYAPRIDNATYNDTNAFSVKTDQTSTENYLASDLVLAKNENVAETTDAVQLSFNHLMAKINITIQKATNATVDLKHAKVSIINTNTATTFKPNATGTGEDKVLGTASTPADITLFSGDGSAEPTTVVGIMVPQDIAAGSGLVKIQTYPGDATNRTLIAKVDELTTFASGGQYSFTVTINDPTAPITYITLKANSTQLVAWNNTNLGAATKEYSIGDYICKDGSLLKASAVTDENKANIVAVIFSNQVSSADASYDGYAVGLERYKPGSDGLTWYESTSYGTWTGYSATNTIEGGFNDLDGRMKSKKILESDTYSGLAENTYHIANLTNYSLAIDAAAITDGILSGWFTPSYGQVIQILNNLGGANITTSKITYNNGQFTNQNVYYEYSNDAATDKVGLTTIISKLQSYRTIAGASGDFLATNVSIATVTENSGRSGEAFWMFASKSGENYQLTAAQAKVPSAGLLKALSVWPVIAFKVK